MLLYEIIFSSSSWISINSAPTWVSEISVSRMNLPSWLQRLSMETMWRLFLWTTWHNSSWLCVSCCLIGSLTVCETKGRKGWHVQPGPINFITNCWRWSGIHRMRRHNCVPRTLHSYSISISSGDCPSSTHWLDRGRVKSGLLLIISFCVDWSLQNYTSIPPPMLAFTFKLVSFDDSSSS